MGQIEQHYFERVGIGNRALQRPDGNIWVIYEQPQNERDVINGFDVPRLFSTAIVRNNGDHVPGSDQLFEIGNRFTFGFFAMATQSDNKLLLGIETGGFFRLNADGSLDSSFNPQAATAGAVVVQPDGKIILVPELVRLNPDGSKDLSFTSSVGDALPSFAGLQSSGKVLVSTNSSPYLRRLNADGSIDQTFVANLPAYIDSGLIFANGAILLRLFQFDPNNGSTVFTLVRLLPDGSADPSFHPDPRFDNFYAIQGDGKILAGFRDSAKGQYFLGRMNVDGTLDSSYQTYPIVVSDANTPPISAVFVQPDGSILAEIIPPLEGQQFLRFSSSGVLDQASKRPFKIPGPVTKLAAPSDAKILVSGDFNFVDRMKTGPLVRLDRSGNLDAAFHPALPANPIRGVDLALQINDWILFSFASGQQFPQERLTLNGGLDPAFPQQNLGPRFEMRSDDKIVTIGYDNVVRRLLSDGKLDPAFSPTQIKFGGNQFDSPVGFAIQPDGKIVAIGNGNSMAGIHSNPVNAAVVRLNPDGGIDNSFNPPTFAGGTRFNCVAVQKDGKILLGGRFGGPSPTANLMRLNTDGSIDPTFVAATDYTVSAILMEDSGTILIGGGFSTVNGQPAPRVAKLKPNGEVDSSFYLDTGGAVYTLAHLADGRIAAGGEFGLVASPPLVPSRLRNISARMFVDSGDNALIAGIIIGGTGEKKLLIRGIGPSLAGAGISGALQDPILELHDSNGSLLASNDDWQSSPNEQEIVDSTIPPSDPKEAAITMTVPANGSTYTAIVRPARGNPGIGLVEVYDLDGDGSTSKLANISARGNVLPGDKAMIGGFIVQGPPSSGPTHVVIRALGPSLPLPGTLSDPTLELHDGSGIVAANDDWKQTFQTEIEETTIPPADDRESAITRWTPPGAYSAVVRGKDASNGIALLEIYNLTN
jgi:uncharacterized delta-60 repeat protein